MPTPKYEDLVDFDHLALYDSQVKLKLASKEELGGLDDRVDDLEEAGGEPNLIDTVKVNGTALVPDSQKAVNVPVPTTIAGMSDANDWATKQYVLDQVGQITGVKFLIVEQLPQTGAAGTIYLVPNSGSAPNIYDEYIYVNSKFEKIGTTDIDLSGYVQDSDITIVTNAQINSLFATGA